MVTGLVPANSPFTHTHSSHPESKAMNISNQGNEARQASEPGQVDDEARIGQQALSALIDGRLRGAVFADAVEAMHRSPQMRADWQVYHLVGDLLRQGEAAGRLPVSDGLAARVAARLAVEPLQAAYGPISVATEIEAKTKAGIKAAPGPWAAPIEAAQAVAGNPAQSVRHAANDPLWRWRALAGVATLTAFAAVGWNLLGGAATTSTGAVPVLAQAEPSRQMLRDPRLDELLAAHEQSAGISALQMPAGFLRNATFEGRGR